MSYTTLSVNPAGNLVITLTDEGRKFLEELEAEGFDDEYILIELLEYHLINGYNRVLPENVGALTSSLILADGFVDEGSTQEELDHTSLWWFPDYAVVSYTDALKIGEELVFLKAA